MNAGPVTVLGVIVAVVAVAVVVFATGGLILALIPAALAVALLVVGARMRRAARDAESAEEDPSTRAPGQPLSNDTRAVFVGTGAPDDPLRSKSP